MHIIFPLDQLQTWESQGEGNAQLQSLICISKLGGPVNIIPGDPVQVDVKEQMRMFQDQFGGVHWAFNADGDQTILMPPISESDQAALMELGKKMGVPMPNGLKPGDMNLSSPRPPEKDFLALGKIQCPICGGRKEESMRECEKCWNNGAGH